VSGTSKHRAVVGNQGASAPGWFRRHALPLSAALALLSGLALVLIALVVLQPGPGGPSGFAGAAQDARHAAGRANALVRPAWTKTPPARLSLPTLDVQAAVRTVVTTSGVLGIPDDPAQVGWWAGSVTPGAPQGSVVLDGHVDSASRGLGALFRLTTLKAGDPVSVATTDGTVVSYRAYARQVLDKGQPLPPELFSTAGPPRLVLITCGGPFDRAAHSYRDNIVVLAAPQA
jgi:hypothetical protein